MVRVNCAAIPSTLIESELFGREKGAYTGALSRQIGRFEVADGSSIFLDEIGELPADVQVKLLRVLQEKEIERLGSSRPVSIDVRVIAATHRDIEKMIADGAFREDLYYRLNVFPIRVPPLRDRERDVELLAEFFLGELSADAGQPKHFDASALDRLSSDDWPGNVRELRNVVERAAILGGERIGPEHVRVDGLVGIPRPEAAITVEVGCSIADAEKRLILATLERLKGDKKAAARTLGISLKTLYNRLNVYGAAARPA